LMRDAQVAGELQRALVTADRRETPTASAAGDLRPACQVGGDLFDLLEVDGDLVAVIADVSGKGTPASLLTAALLSTVQGQVNVIGAHPGALLRAVGTAMEGMLHRTGRIVTLAIAAVDSRAGVVRIASAGHHPVFVDAGGTVTVIRPTCPPLGVVPPSADEQVVAFPVGTTILLASDGLVDQCDPWGIPFGMRQLADTFAKAPDHTPSEVVSHLLKAIKRHAGVAPQDDDRAAVVLVSRSRP
jgi:serine phosphatase RsbU (regulator of sigma subunit)